MEKSKTDNVQSVETTEHNLWISAYRKNIRLKVSKSFQTAQADLSEYVGSDILKTEMPNLLMGAREIFAKNQESNDSFANLDQVMEVLVISVFYIRGTKIAQMANLSQEEKTKRERETSQVLGILESLSATASEQVSQTNLDSLFEGVLMKEINQSINAIFSVDPKIFPEFKKYLERLSGTNSDLNLIQIDYLSQKLVQCKEKLGENFYGVNIPIQCLLDNVVQDKINIAIITEEVYLREIKTSAPFKYASEQPNRPQIFFIVEMTDHRQITIYHRSSFNNGSILRIEEAK